MLFRSAYERGLSKVPELAEHLFQFQRTVVEFNLRVGTSGLFLDTGLGKTECQLEWCQKAIEATNGRALILTPLAVAGQTKRRADKYGYEARVIRDQSEAGPGINIINYDRLDKIDPTQFGLIMIFNLILGTIHPPIGVVLFVTSRIAGISYEAMSRAILPWLLPLLAVLALITIFPVFTTFLPNLLMPSR